MMEMPDLSVLPDKLADLLSRVGSKLAAQRRIRHNIAGVADLLGQIDPLRLQQAEAEIVWTAKLFRWRPTPTILEMIFARKVSEASQLRSVDGLKYLFIFHRDGWLREAALRMLDGPLPNAFLFTAIAWRLNDWVGPVRVAAAECAARTFPETPPEVVADAAPTLLARQMTWGRWDSERGILDEAFARADVTSCLAKILLTRATGPMASLLRQLSRTDRIDQYLDQLSDRAVQPAVRAAATQSLLNGYAEWPDGWRWRWVDKPMGIRRCETVFKRRPLECSGDREALIRRALKDRAAVVRSAAISALIESEAGVADARALAATMLGDRSAAVRERAEFILNRVEQARRT